MSLCRQLAAASSLFVWALTMPSFAQAEAPRDAFELPDLPASPTLPDLTHRALAVSFDMTVASVQPSVADSASRPPRALGWLERLEIEQALGSRRWHLGAAIGFAVGDAPARLAVSQPEAWGRAVWASRAGLAYGGGLGLVLPSFRYSESTREALIEGYIRVVRPWDYTSFLDKAFTFRPFVDMRIVDGPVLLQLRQGIDWAMPTGHLDDPLIASRTTLHVGYRVTERVQLGLEASEVYFIRAHNVNDEDRATFTMSPSIRLMMARVQPLLSAILPLDQTVLGTADSFWAVRAQIAFVVD